MTVQKLELSDTKPEALTIKLNEAQQEKPRSFDNYMLTELVSTQKKYNELADVMEEKLNMIEKSIKELREPRTEKLEAEQVVLTLHKDTIKASGIMALGSVFERPISNGLHSLYPPLTTGTYGIILGLVGMGLTYRKGGDWKQWLAQGYFIGGVSQIVQDIFGYIATKTGLPVGSF